MEPSDWIALGALAVAVVSIVFNYLSNRANIKARRMEIVTEKSLEAFRETVENLNVLVSMAGRKDKDGLSDAVSACYAAYRKYKLYLPDTIGDDYVWLVEGLRLSLTGELVNSYKKDEYKPDPVYLASKLIKRMQNHMGVEREATAPRRPGFSRRHRFYPRL